MTQKSISTGIQPQDSMINEQAPQHPGEVLRKEYMEPFGLTGNKLALALHVSPPRITERLFRWNMTLPQRGNLLATGWSRKSGRSALSDRGKQTRIFEKQQEKKHAANKHQRNEEPPFRRSCATAEGGETVIICRRNKPIEELKAVEPEKKVLRKRPVGLARKRYPDFKLADDFNEPLPDDILAAFNGEEE